MTYKEAENQNCPNCGSDTFATTDSEPVTTGGWYGNTRFEWQSNPHVVVATQARCSDCEHVEGLEF